MSEQTYPIGTLGQPWTDAEKQQWLNNQTKKRSFFERVEPLINELSDDYDAITYGHLNYDTTYPLYALKHKNWHQGRPIALVTGGVHGYETSGVHGAIAFAKQASQAQSEAFNILIVPCVSPWGYETINRWNPNAIDPNRSFYEESPADESRLLLNFVAQFGEDIVVHIDLHETTDTDNSEFRPALAARDGKVNSNWNIPDGFYVVADSERPESAFQQAIINHVKTVTQIAPADENNQLIGVDLQQHGVIEYAGKALGLCMGLTNARFVTTTEVYPDGANATDENCVAAQVAAVNAALAFAKTR
ncbi:M14 family metallopeptidase [Pseudoalteromonas sp. SSDWG2]|uniref:M14 family metallopeptidase n=1 Tax=Pseudoalteromonas sp. SSDWG2 TaxID=3139391 RepID=UPI003BA9A6D9